MPLDKTPAPFGALVAHKAIGFSPGVFSNGIFSSVLSPPSVLRTIASVQPDGAEEKGMRYDFGLGGSSRTTRAAGRIIKPRGLRSSIRSMMMLTER